MSARQPAYTRKDLNQQEREKLGLLAINKTFTLEIKKAEDAQKEKEKEKKRLELVLTSSKDTAHVTLEKLLHLSQLESRRALLNICIDPLCNSEDEIKAGYAEQMSMYEGVRHRHWVAGVAMEH